MGCIDEQTAVNTAGKGNHSLFQFLQIIEQPLVDSVMSHALSRHVKLISANTFITSTTINNHH
jgi:hypothetical protein